jgi:hypothetical protein
MISYLHIENQINVLFFLATATLAHDTFNISIPLKPRKPLVIKFIGNETEGVYVKSPGTYVDRESSRQEEQNPSPQLERGG